MKKVLSMILVVAITLSLCACGTNQSGESTEGNQSVEETGFRVGYGRTSILPEEPVYMGAMGGTKDRVSTGYLDYLYAICLAITDDKDNTLLLFSIDAEACFGNIFPELNQQIAEQFGIPAENVQVSATHTHNAPEMDLKDDAAIARYIVNLKQWMIEAAEEALADRKAATMHTASVETEGLNFLRRYILENGEIGDDMTNWNENKAVEYEDAVDSQLQLVKFVREGGNDVIMANFQQHPHRGQSATTTDLSSNVVGVFRDQIEQKLGSNVIYFSGASGDVNGFSRIPEDNIYSDYVEQGIIMANYAVNAEYTQVQTGEVKVVSTVKTIQQDKSRLNLLEEAKIFNGIYVSTMDEKAAAAAVNNVITSRYDAQGIIQSYSLADTRDLTIHAFSIGDVGFVTAPYEMFSRNGESIKARSPFQTTFVLTQANNAFGYVPSAEAFANGGYERAATLFVEGTAEVLEQAYVDMLTELAG